MKQALRISPAGAVDVASLAALSDAAFGGDGWSASEIAATLNTPGAAALLALRTGPTSGPEAVGFAIWRRLVDDAELLTIGVAPPERRSGVGRALLAETIAAAAAGGLSRLFLEVAADNAPAAALYMGAGFETLDRRRGYYGPGRDAIAMALEVARAGRKAVTDQGGAV